MRLVRGDACDHRAGKSCDDDPEKAFCCSPGVGDKRIFTCIDGVVEVDNCVTGGCALDPDNPDAGAQCL